MGKAMSSYAADLSVLMSQVENVLGSGSTLFGRKRMCRKLSTLQVNEVSLRILPTGPSVKMVSSLVAPSEGAGNSFLGGLSAGLQLENGDVFEGKLNPFSKSGSVLKGSIPNNL